MNKNFALRISEYLDSECDDYDMEYDYEWCEDSGFCVATIKKKDSDIFKCLNFKYDNENDDLLIELSEDSFHITREFDYSVKYFWMLVSPSLFPNN